MVTKEKIKVVSESEFQRESDQFVSRNVYLVQSSLVDHLLEKEIFCYDDIQNFYESWEFVNKKTGTCEQCEEVGEVDENTEHCEEHYEPQPNEILEWWLVSDWFKDKLRSKGEAILENDYGEWWGRCTSGQAIAVDHVVREIVRETLGIKSGGYHV